MISEPSQSLISTFLNPSSYLLLHPLIKSLPLIPLLPSMKSLQLLLFHNGEYSALLIGYDLINFVIGDLQCPAINAENSATFKAVNSHWIRQDKLTLHVLLALTSTTITPLLASCKTSHEAWNKLTYLYAGKSRTRAM